jgi:hypothetical protein
MRRGIMGWYRINLVAHRTLINNLFRHLAKLSAECCQSGFVPGADLPRDKHAGHLRASYLHSVQENPGNQPRTIKLTDY